MEEEKVQNNQTKKEESRLTPESEEDSVLKDINTAKGLIKKAARNVSSKLSPGLKKVKEKGRGVKPSSFIDKNFIKKAVRLFVIAVLMIALIYIGVIIFRSLQQNGRVATNVELTPTPADYRPYEPSVYADDPEVLQIEEEVDVLEKEISGKNLRESSLTPPTLDWNVRFKD